MKGLMVNFWQEEVLVCWSQYTTVVFREKDTTSGCVQNTRVYLWQVSGEFLSWSPNEVLVFEAGIFGRELHPK